MKKILLSLGTLAIVGAVVAGATGAFYGDTETSTGNTFTAGAIELKVDSVSHYNGMVCTEDGGWQPSGNTDAFGVPVGFPTQGSDCNGTWTETNLKDGVQKFFNFTDLKPGDHGEDTISLHVYDNDAWGRFVIFPTRDADNTCTTPEIQAEEALDKTCESPDGDGEMDDNLLFTGWLDQGAIPGFQNTDADGNPVYANENDSTGENDLQLVDPTEGDNIYQNYEGPKFWNSETIGNLTNDLSGVLSAEYERSCTDTSIGTGNPNGSDNYGFCQGLAQDGRMVGSTTYYFGLAWDLPLDTGNEVQSDEYTANLIFQVEQLRNNPTPFED
ncbi:MAG: hypothetical protein GXP44_02400 [bacterium]|nr:hypothetical protein [bacterium]